MSVYVHVDILQWLHCKHYEQCPEDLLQMIN